MKVKLVSDIMLYLDEYPAIINTATLHDAVELMENYQIDIKDKKSLPRVLLVLDKRDQLVGFLRRRDIFRGLMPEFFRRIKIPEQARLFDIKVDPELSQLSGEQVIEEFKRHAAIPIEEVMLDSSSIEILTINYDDNVLKAINIMIDENIPLLPVIHNDRVVGVLRTVDIFHEVARLIL